jgi:hypothetical protein
MCLPNFHVCFLYLSGPTALPLRVIYEGLLIFLPEFTHPIRKPHTSSAVHTQEWARFFNPIPRNGPDFSTPFSPLQLKQKQQQQQNTQKNPSNLSIVLAMAFYNIQLNVTEMICIFTKYG